MIIGKRIKKKLKKSVFLFFLYPTTTLRNKTDVKNIPYDNFTTTA